MRTRAALLMVCLVAVSADRGHAQSNRTTWMDYGGGPDNARYVTLDQIRTVVSSLEAAVPAQARAETRDAWHRSWVMAFILITLSAEFLTCTSIVSPTRTRTNGPGTRPLNVQKR